MRSAVPWRERLLAQEQRHGASRRSRRASDGCGGHRQPFSHRLTFRSLALRRSRAACRRSCAASARPRTQWLLRAPMLSSSSTVRTSPIAWRGGYGGARLRSRFSTTFRRRFGLGGRGGQRAMRRYIDCVLAILPFEPATHRAARRPAVLLCRAPADRAPRRPPPQCGGDAAPAGRSAGLFLVLPGSRSSELHRLARDFWRSDGARRRADRRDGVGSADDAASPGEGARRDRRLAHAAADRCRAGGEVGGFSQGAGGARGVGDSDTGTGACRGSDRCGLSGTADRRDRCAAAAGARNFHGRADQSGHRRKYHSGISAARLYAGKARRRSRAAHFRHCRTAAPDRGLPPARSRSWGSARWRRAASRRHRGRRCPARPPRSGGRPGGVHAQASRSAALVAGIGYFRFDIG